MGFASRVNFVDYMGFCVVYFSVYYMGLCAIAFTVFYMGFCGIACLLCMIMNSSKYMRFNFDSKECNWPTMLMVGGEEGVVLVVGIMRSIFKKSFCSAPIQKLCFFCSSIVWLVDCSYVCQMGQLFPSDSIVQIVRKPLKF